jgi:hypothetical protein
MVGSLGTGMTPPPSQHVPRTLQEKQTSIEIPFSKGRSGGEGEGGEEGGVVLYGTFVHASHCTT